MSSADATAPPPPRSVLRAALSTRGRSGRIGFWMSVAMAVLCAQAAEALRFTPLTIQLLALCVAALAPWLLITAAARRLHDLGYSGYYQLLVLVPVLGQIAFFFGLGALPGDPDENRFGPPPEAWWRS